MPGGTSEGERGSGADTRDGWPGTRADRNITWRADRNITWRQRPCMHTQTLGLVVQRRGDHGRRRPERALTGVVPLVNVIPLNQTLTHLDLSYNGLGDAGVCSLVRTLSGIWAEDPVRMKVHFLGLAGTRMGTRAQEVH